MHVYIAAAGALPSGCALRLPLVLACSVVQSVYGVARAMCMSAAARMYASNLWGVAMKENVGVA